MPNAVPHQCPEMSRRRTGKPVAGQLGWLLLIFVCNTDTLGGKSRCCQNLLSPSFSATLVFDINIKTF